MAIVLDEKGFYWGEDDALSLDERRVNAAYIRDTLITTTWAFYCPGHEMGTVPAWTVQAIAAFLGNVRVESWINPGLYEHFTPSQSGGYGLVQWTPGTLLRNWAQGLDLPTYDIDVQLARLQYEYDNHLEWSARPGFTDVPNFRAFTQGTDIPHLTEAFWRNYLRSAASSLDPESPEYQEARDMRVSAAQAWYSFLLRTPAKPPWRPSGSKFIYKYRRERRM